MSLEFSCSFLHPTQTRRTSLMCAVPQWKHLYTEVAVKRRDGPFLAVFIIIMLESSVNHAEKASGSFFPQSA